MDVSYIVINFKTTGLLELNLEVNSREMSHLDSEFIIVDNGSSGTLPDCAAIKQAGPVHIIKNGSNLGFGRAANRAFAHAKGKYVLFVNPDTFLLPGSVTELFSVLDEYDNAAIAAPCLLNTDGSVQGSARSDLSFRSCFFGRSSLATRFFPNNPFSRQEIVQPDKRRRRSVDWVSGACMLFRRAAFEAVGGFDERYFMYCEDADICRELRRLGYSIIYSPLSRALHFGGCSSEFAPYSAIAAHHKSAYHYFLKHIYPKAPLPVRATVATGLAVRAGARCFAHALTRAFRTKRNSTPAPETILAPYLGFAAPPHEKSSSFATQR